MIIKTNSMQGKVDRIIMRTNKLIKNKQEMKANRLNLKNYILMEVVGLIETEEVGVKGLEVLMLVRPEDEAKEIMIRIVKFVAKVMKKKRKITKFQIKN
jgi:hypothetical protein